MAIKEHVFLNTHLLTTQVTLLHVVEQDSSAESYTEQSELSVIQIHYFPATFSQGH